MAGGWYWPVMMPHPPPGMQVGGWVGGQGWRLVVEFRGMIVPSGLPARLTQPPPSAAGAPVLLQFGNVDMSDVMPPAGLYPYPFYHPAPYSLPPGAMPLAHPHHLPYGGGGLDGGEGQLAPFPAGMPLPLPAEAAAAAEQAAIEWAEPAATDGGRDDGEEAAACAVPAAQGQPPATASNGGFLAMLREARGAACAPQASTASTASEADSWRHGGGHPRGRQPPRFDPAAAAAEMERRWQATAPTAVRASSLAPPAALPAAATATVLIAPRSSSKGAALASRGSSGSIGASKVGIASKAFPPSGGSGRNSPVASVAGSGPSAAVIAAAAAGGATKPVVVAVRAWSSDDSTSDGPRWKIQTGRQQQAREQEQPAK